MATETKRLLQRDDIKTMRKDIKSLKGFSNHKKYVEFETVKTEKVKTETVKTPEDQNKKDDKSFELNQKTVTNFEVKKIESLKPEAKDAIDKKMLEKKIVPIIENKTVQNNAPQSLVKKEVPNNQFNLTTDIKKQDNKGQYQNSEGLKKEDPYREKVDNVVPLVEKEDLKVEAEIKKPVPENPNSINEKRKSFLEEVEELAKQK